MQPIRVIFMGTPIFSCSILETLINEKYNVVAVVSQPDKKVGRKQEMQMTPVKKLALANNIEVVQPISIKDEYEKVLAYKPDLIVTCAYGQFIPKVILDYPKYGCINVHASLLPRYRGGAPIHKVIIDGEKETGITIMEMIPKMDAGKMYAKDSVVITEDDTTASLHDKLMVCGANLLKNSLPLYLDGKLPGEIQDESLATFAYNISKEEEYISFKRDVNVVYNHIRGLISWPVGYGVVNEKRIKLHKVRKLVANHNYQSGKILGLENGALKVACENGYVYLEQLQIEGKKKMSAKEVFNGHKELFEDAYFN